MMSGKIKRAARKHHAHAQSSIDPLAHLARSYLCARALWLKKEYKLVNKNLIFANILIGYRDDW